MSSGGFASSYVNRPQDFSISLEHPAGTEDGRPFQIGRGFPLGAHIARFCGWSVLTLMVATILALRPELMTAPIALLIAIIPVSTVGVMLIICGLEGIARRERRQLIAQNEQITAMLGNLLAQPGAQADEALYATFRTRLDREDEQEPGSGGNVVPMANPKIYQLGIAEGIRRAINKEQLHGSD